MITQAKEPGITAEQHRRPVVMDMSYASQFEGAYVGDAYERMFLNAARGDQALFVSAAELVEAWRIFTPLLHQIDELRPPPALHPFGALPEGYVSWAKHHGVEIHPTWQEYVVAHGSKIEQMTKVFHELDRDGSGALSFAEVTELARRFYDGRVPTEAKVKSIFRAFDKNEKGEVTLDAMPERPSTPPFTPPFAPQFAPPGDARRHAARRAVDAARVREVVRAAVRPPPRRRGVELGARPQVRPPDERPRHERTRLQHPRRRLGPLEGGRGGRRDQVAGPSTDGDVCATRSLACLGKGY